MTPVECLWLRLRWQGLTGREIIRLLAHDINELFRCLGATFDTPFAQMLYAFAAGRCHDSRKARIGFFSPGTSYRDYAGRLPQELRCRGYDVVFLYGDPNDSRLRDDDAIFAGGGIIQYIDWLDLILVPTVMDCLHPKVPTVLMPHTLIGGVTWNVPGMENNSGLHETMTPKEISALPAYDRVTDFTKFFTLFDYISSTTNHMKERTRQLMRYYGKFREGEERAEMAPDAAELLDRLGGHSRLDQVLIHVDGYLPLDLLRDTLSERKTEPDSVIYAPTLTSVYDARITSLMNMGVLILSALLEYLPDYKVIFRPHPHEKTEVVEKIAALFQGNPRFVLSCGRSYMNEYVGSALMVSDLSNTAYTFAASTLRPVIFVSPGEHLIQRFADLDCDALRLREGVGWVVDSHEALLKLLDSGEPLSLEARNRVKARIGELFPRDPPAFMKFADAVDAILAGRIPEGAEVYR